MEERWHKIQELWKSHKSLYGIAGFIIGILLFPALQYFFTDSAGLLKDLVPEAFGIIFAVFVIDRIYRMHERRAREQNLIDIIRAGVHGPAESALHELKSLDKLNLLQTISFYKINLSGARLFAYDMPHVRFIESLFSKSTLSHVDLSNGLLGSCDFSDSRLDGVNFASADLRSTSFQKSVVKYCNFSGCQLGAVDFRDSNLRGCVLRNAELITVYHIMDDKKGQSIETVLPTLFSDNTTLPNGEKWDSTTMDLEYLRDTYGESN